MAALANSTRLRPSSLCASRRNRRGNVQLASHNRPAPFTPLRRHLDPVNPPDMHVMWKPQPRLACHGVVVLAQQVKRPGGWVLVHGKGLIYEENASRSEFRQHSTKLGCMSRSLLCNSLEYT
ncbi:uncharacterized protein PV09_03103 [Verruconis gallopava]|uniref:Uncharacterized protein n=1 Tax=Verruconis gallopava TaxID=253628 RepID=A0A0D2B3T8_9PEZI|nr:uncharacterized protein PV09_03103 [Verruconis gallopava]KIW05909.1 hypothetical protein PV09_03103 [Verruconis gallopava]